MAPNNGKLAENWFEQHWHTKRKSVMLYQFEDFYQTVFKKGGKASGKSSKPQPADYLLTEGGSMGFAEVKSSQNKTAFPFSDVRSIQWRMARKQLAANGIYDFYLLNINTLIWYKVPAKILIATKDMGVKSLNWKKIKPYIWQPEVAKPENAR